MKSTAERSISIAIALWAAALAACGQDPPPDPVTGGDYHPLVDGSSWRYAHDDWTETVTLTSTMFEGEPAFLMSDSPNPSDRLRSDAVLTKVNGRIARVSKDEYLISAGADEGTLQSSTTYGVGFTRFNEDWANQSVGFRESPEYVRVETRPGEPQPRPPEDRKHSFEIISLSVDLVTPAGTFDCIQIRRTKDWQAEADGLDTDEAQTKDFWFSRGVGKVREENVDTGSSETLIEFEIPDASQ
jgi:hypothetical protein